MTLPYDNNSISIGRMFSVNFSNTKSCSKSFSPGIQMINASFWEKGLTVNCIQKPSFDCITVLWIAYIMLIWLRYWIINVIETHLRFWKALYALKIRSFVYDSNLKIARDTACVPSSLWCVPELYRCTSATGKQAIQVLYSNPRNNCRCDWIIVLFIIKAFRYLYKCILACAVYIVCECVTTSLCMLPLLSVVVTNQVNQTQSVLWDQSIVFACYAGALFYGRICVSL